MLWRYLCSSSGCVSSICNAILDSFSLCQGTARSPRSTERQRKKKRKVDKSESSKPKRRTGRRKKVSSTSGEKSHSLDSGSPVSHPPGETGEVIRLKCVFNEEIRILPIPHSIHYDELLKHLAQEYEGSLVLQYKDQDGDLITVRSQSDLAVMMSENSSSMKVYLKRHAPPLL